MNMAMPGTRRRGRPKNTWDQQIQADMADAGVTQGMALDRKEMAGRTGRSGYE